MKRGNSFSKQLHILPTGHGRSGTRRLERPRLEVRVLQSPLRHRLDGPIVCRFEIRRAGDARTMHIRNLVDDPHDPGIVCLFRADLRVDVGNRRRLRGKGHRY